MSIRSRIAEFRGRESGAVSVEFALIAPILIAMLFGIVCFGYLFGISASLQQLAGESARISAQGLNTTERRTLAESYIASGSEHFPLLIQGNITPDVTLTEGTIPDIEVVLTYGVDGTVLALVRSLFANDFNSITRRSYLVY